jgi:predicted protein tyrosine phosphatase
MEAIPTIQPDPPIPDSYWVLPGRLLAGEYPRNPDDTSSRAKLRRFLLAGVRSFLDLTEEEEYHILPYVHLLWQEAAALGVAVHYQRMSIPDMDVPAPEHMDRILDRLDGELAAGHTVYVHCLGGVGRTGTVIGCYLVRHGLTGQQALREIEQLRRRMPDGWQSSPQTEAQCAMVLTWTE